MKTDSRSLILILSLMVSGCAHAPKKETAAATIPLVTTKYAPAEIPFWAQPYYLTALPAELDHAVPPPPADGSKDDQADFKELLKWQKKRTRAQCDAAKEQQIPTLDNVFGYAKNRKTSPDFTKLAPQTYEELKTFFQRYQRDVAFVALEEKERFKRKRPYDRNPKIEPCIKREGSAAYPSGHAAFGSAGAALLDELFPQSAKAFHQDAEQIGKNRILGGVHHPSDIVYGEELGLRTFEYMKKDPRFSADLDALKKAVAGKSTL